MEKFRKIFRIPSARAPFQNYTEEGYYFITICTAGRECLFGTIIDKIIHLSPIGEIVQQEWNRSFDIRAELFCDAFVIMPNHIHAIVRIQYPPVETHGSASPDNSAPPVETHGSASQNNGAPQVETHGSASPDNVVTAAETHNRASLQTCPTGVAYRPPKSISSFVAGFKSSSTKRINEYRDQPGTAVWQTRFHDHIIRDENEYQRIKTYIEQNAENWNQDSLYH